jgi:UDP-N-acetyl-D-mannosaminuronic acid dehydrogenase
MQNGIFKVEDLDKTQNALNRKVCIFGQGFIGLPLTLSFATGGCATVGVDVDDMLVANINKGITHHTEKFNDVPIQQILKIELDEGRYTATTDGAKAVRECNNIIVTVGIPIKDGKFIMYYLEDACRTIGKNLKKQDLVIIRSTVIPGTTEDFILPIIEKESGMRAGVDFYLAYASERIAEGNAFDEFASMPTLVGAVNNESLYRAKDLLSVVCKAEIVSASCIKAVETSKVFENIQRDVNIAMSQEFARFTEVLGIDIFEVIKLANTHKRVNLLIPGPGVGGYCIPNAYHYLEPKAKEFGLTMDLLKLAREKNASIPEFIVNKTEELLNCVGKELKGSRIAVLGLAMKDYSNDDRISGPVEICKLLTERGAKVRAFDPIVQGAYEFKSKTQDEALQGADAILILAKQQGIYFNDIENIVKKMNQYPVCIDAKATIDMDEALKYGLKYWRI